MAARKIERMGDTLGGRYVRPRPPEVARASASGVVIEPPGYDFGRTAVGRTSHRFTRKGSPHGTVTAPDAPPARAASGDPGRGSPLGGEV
ncbi:hypothetical protein GCM10010331_38880 [Streptomyces xanthochromogenes]|nr:hypothetical protein GCM10010331_38880 [Streptomyces xanthochromogenes]